MEHERVKTQRGAADTATARLIFHRGCALTVSTQTPCTRAHSPTNTCTPAWYKATFE